MMRKFVEQLCVWLVIVSLPAMAQADGPQLVFKAEAGVVHQSEADLSDASGGFAADRWFVSGGVDYVWDARHSIGLSLGGGKSVYDFTSTTVMAGGKPWGTIEDSRVTITGRFGIGQRGVVLILPTVRYNAENGAGTGDGTTYGIFAAVAWQIWENISIGPGIGVFSRLEHSARVFPVLAIDWDISERWNLSTGRGLASSQGPGLTLSYKLNQDWSFGLAGRYEDIEFRLNDDGPAAGGVGRDQSFPLVAIATLKPNQRLTLAAFAGLELAGNLRLKNVLGTTIEDSSYDPAPLLGATFEFRF